MIRDTCDDVIDVDYLLVNESAALMDYTFRFIRYSTTLKLLQAVPLFYPIIFDYRERFF